VVILGVVLICVALLVPKLAVLFTIGIIVLIVGLVLLTLGHFHGPVGGRRYWYLGLAEGLAGLLDGVGQILRRPGVQQRVRPRAPRHGPARLRDEPDLPAGEPLLEFGLDHVERRESAHETSPHGKPRPGGSAGG
jgi:hypothetical protein